MILITGGAYQGKRAFAQQNYNIKSEDILDCAECEIEKILSAGCVCNFHTAVRKMLENGINPLEYAQKIIDRNNDIIIITNEIGCGIIPIEKSEREWREAVGKVCCILASNAESVIRVTCGIPLTIK